MPMNDPRAARLALALREEGLTLPEAGAICVLGPRAGDDLSLLPRERAQLVQGFRPDHDALSRAGWQVAPRLEEGRFAASIVCLPRAREEAHDLIARAVSQTDGPVIVDGQKTEGADAVLRACRARAGVAGVVSKGHGKLFWMPAPAPEAFADWQAQPRRLEGGFVTRPGVFSADGPDPGSMLLAGALPARLPPRIADLGAGWGWLAAQILTRDGVEELHLVEAGFEALDCARENIRDPRARFHWADATRFDGAAGLDAVVMNPPFHTGRKGDPALGVAFIDAAARLLGPQGRLWMVANRHLPYEAALAAAFRRHEEIAGSSAFKVHLAQGPRKPPPRTR